MGASLATAVIRTYVTVSCDYWIVKQNKSLSLSITSLTRFTFSKCALVDFAARVTIDTRDEYTTRTLGIDQIVKRQVSLASRQKMYTYW